MLDENELFNLILDMLCHKFKIQVVRYFCFNL